MRIGLIIADFEMNYTSSFQHTARAKYGVDFDSSDVEAIVLKLKDLKTKIELKQHYNVHVGFEITFEHVAHVENLLNQILDKYNEIFYVLPPDRKVYTIIRKLKEVESPSAKDLAKEALNEVFNPQKVSKPTRAEKIKADAEKLSKQRALAIIRKNSAKDK